MDSVFLQGFTFHLMFHQCIFIGSFNRGFLTEGPQMQSRESLNMDGGKWHLCFHDNSN